MHLFSELPLPNFDYRYAFAVECGGLFVEGTIKSALCDLSGHPFTFVSCNVTGEPVDFDDACSRAWLFRKARTAQQIDGFHL